MKAEVSTLSASQKDEVFELLLDFRDSWFGEQAVARSTDSEQAKEAAFTGAIALVVSSIVSASQASALAIAFVFVGLAAALAFGLLQRTKTREARLWDGLAQAIRVLISAI